MADIHILGGSYQERNGRVSKRVALHFPIDVADQVAAAASDPDLVGFVSEVPNLATDDPAEDAAIKAGQVVEVVISVNFGLVLTPAERLALIRQEYAALTTTVAEQYRARYYEYLNTFTAT